MPKSAQDLGYTTDEDLNKAKKPFFGGIIIGALIGSFIIKFLSKNKSKYNIKND